MESHPFSISFEHYDISGCHFFRSPASLPSNSFSSASERSESLHEFSSNKLKITLAEIPKKRLLLLHGAGLAGELTWSFVRHYLTEWDEILVPDFPGMGASNWHNSIQEFDVDALVESCVALIEYFGWKQFDIVGYSMGGLVAMHFVALNPIVCTKLYLIEPAALLSDKPSILVERGETYLKLSQRILAHANDPESYVDFLNHVSPLRKKNSKTDTVALERLQQNSQGLAMGLQCVGLALIKYADWYANWTAPVPGLSIVGGLSHQSMHNRHQLLCDGSAEWFYHSLSNADHSLVYSKPRQVAGLLNTAFNKPF